MEQLINIVKELKNSPNKKIIEEKMFEFSELGKKSSNEIFKELCFCLLTANFSAQGGIKIQNEIGDGFIQLSLEDLAKKLSELGHRFPNTRAGFIFEARKNQNDIKKILSSFPEDKTRRDWLVKNIKGLGMKESSHFLRNIGYKNVAIIDFHIVDLLVSHGIIKKPQSRSLTNKQYLEIEAVLEKICNETNLCQGELDLYLWYKETGKILK